MKQIKCSELSIAPDLKLFHAGPSLDLGAMPTLFYFSLSGPDSLCTPPFNQIVQFLSGKPLRVFSMNLPAHENGLSPDEALHIWAEEMAKGQDPLGRFLEQVQIAIGYAFKEKLIAPGKLAAAGLSRGALLASLLAAQDDRVPAVLGFAPLSRLAVPGEFQAIRHLPIVEKYDISLYGSQLASKRIRFYIGNLDQRVSTRACFECVEAIAAAAAEKKILSPQIELNIYPSIGRHGHGTPAEIFRQGAEWISTLLS